MGNCNKVLTGFPGYATKSPCLENQGKNRDTSHLSSLIHLRCTSFPFFYSRPKFVKRQKSPGSRFITLEPSVQLDLVALWDWHRRFIRSDALPQILNQQNLFGRAQFGDFRNITNAHCLSPFFVIRIALGAWFNNAPNLLVSGDGIRLNSFCRRSNLLPSGADPAPISIRLSLKPYPAICVAEGTLVRNVPSGAETGRYQSDSANEQHQSLRLPDRGV